MSRHVRQLLSDIAMTDPGVAMSPGFLMAKAAADGKFPPVTDADRILLACQKAAVRAEDERKRIPQPQLELGHV